jgi:hypothetical protein
MSEIEIPLIWTSKGNLPVSELEYKTEWSDHKDYITFTEAYFHCDELVKSNCHVYNKVSIGSMLAENNKF